ncbi:PTS lactose/cellobiose transporter subunit IIA [Pradoshia sp. D12]|nr:MULTISPECIES: PTS lactose/cellobiose transporter subunit IIA [Bacillaceae]QFK73273.1 PTS lactose/cellobiose transporter subunit IIA [Pradoshia sp. D12]TPF73813.1 PTS lactose/cellobiose transporter subunit IIA [Bacillus sp. D12]
MNEVEKFRLILHGGDGRSCAVEAIAAAKHGDYSLAHQKLKESTDAILMAHQTQVCLLQKETEEVMNVSFLMLLAQNNLMKTLTVKNMAAEFVELYESSELHTGIDRRIYKNV